MHAAMILEHHVIEAEMRAEHVLRVAAVVYAVSRLVNTAVISGGPRTDTLPQCTTSLEIMVVFTSVWPKRSCTVRRA